MAAQLRFSPLPNSTFNLAGIRRFHNKTPHFPSITLPRSSNLNLSQSLTSPDPPIFNGGTNNNNNNNNNNGGGGGGWNSDDPTGDDHPSSEPSDPVGPLGLFLKGWRSRVAADPEFPFKVLMEELVGVTSNVLGDMASRPNFGLNELDFVFSTLVVGSIVNFVLMYLLAPTSTSSISSSSSLPSYIFEPGPFSLVDRTATFFVKGVTFALVGFAAGLAGTAISNGLIGLRKRMDPEFETENKAPPTVLNGLTWAAHMGVSANFRYQTLNGLEFVMAKGLPPAGFKAVVVVLRCLNNVLGGMSFVALARMTGSQKVEEKEKERLIGEVVVVGEEMERSESQSK